MRASTATSRGGKVNQQRGRSEISRCHAGSYYAKFRLRANSLNLPPVGSTRVGNEICEPRSGPIIGRSFSRSGARRKSDVASRGGISGSTRDLTPRHAVTRRSRAGRARSTRASHRSARGRRRGRPRGRSEPVRASRSRQLASSDRLRAYWRESPARTSRTRRERHPTRFVSILRSRTARAFARARLPRLVGASTGRAIGRTSIARDGYRLLSRFPPSFLSARVRARARP